jgi:hypothetical protein
MRDSTKKDRRCTSKKMRMTMPVMGMVREKKELFFWGCGRCNLWGGFYERDRGEVDPLINMDDKAQKEQDF